MLQIWIVKGEGGVRRSLVRCRHVDKEWIATKMGTLGARKRTPCRILGCLNSIKRPLKLL